MSTRTTNKLVPYEGMTVIPSPRPLSISNWTAARTSHELTQRVKIDAIHEQCRAVLTKVAMENIGALSALEQYLYKFAPFGEMRYQRIADAYAIAAATKIMGW